MKFLILDFDGTLIPDSQGKAYDPASMTLLPGVGEGLRILRNAGMRFFIVSNQSKIGRGTCTEENVQSALNECAQLLKNEGVMIEASRFCPHHPEDDCDCRKPKTGLWTSLCEEHPELTADETIIIGDKDSDIRFGETIGCRTARIPSQQYPNQTNADFTGHNLSEIAGQILSAKEELSQYSLTTAITFADRMHAEGKTIVTTNGAFDLLHAGHRFLLSEARKNGDILIVGINSDASVRRRKGEGRPIEPQNIRARNVARLADCVFIFDDDDPRPWLSQIRPQIHVNAATYGEQCVERSVLDTIGATLVLVEVKPELGSTTAILSKIHPSE
ncbi:MAG: HAD-IIIA family hydrolase [Candidatus Peregrinibacteria bacterium]